MNREKIKITWHGTAALTIEAGGERLLLDPFTQLRGAEHPRQLSEFRGAETIFVTHGHFDHLMCIAPLLELDEPTVFCTKTPAETLEKFTDCGDLIAQIKPGLTIPVGQFTVRVFQGRHVTFDKKLACQNMNPLRALKYIYNFPFLFKYNPLFPEAGESLALEIEVMKTKIMVLGSLALDDQEVYPTGADLLVMPYQGNSYLEMEAQKVIRALKPERIFLSHFDNAFPPLSRTVSTTGLKKMMKDCFPKIEVVKPTVGKPVYLTANAGTYLNRAENMR